MSLPANKKPYPNKCYLPFILYPPGMHVNTENAKFLDNIPQLHEEGDDFVLYVGIPFCRTRCKSCPYFARLLPENDPHDKEARYIHALLSEIEIWSKYKKWKTGKIRSIYIGGGTGSILKVENLKLIVEKIFNSFQVADNYEFTLEGNARDFDEQKIDYVVSSKINRLSLGVQSFQEEILKVVGSPHAALDSIRVIKGFQQRGFKNIQLDLMYNMPGHNMEIWKKDLNTLAKLDIPHFTIYLYRIHKDTPQFKLIERGKVEEPSSPESQMVKSMYKEAKDIAENMGYSMYMVDHFCKPGYENMYNHWNWKAYIDTLAIGPGSYSYYDGYRLGTETDVEKYIESLNQGSLLISTVTDRMSERVQKERYIIFALLYYSIEYSYYYKKFKSNLLEDFSEEVDRLKNKGLITITDKDIKLTEPGLIWHTNVILEFFNHKFWGDTNSLTEPNWSLNGVMVEVGAHSREYWLGDKEKLFFS